MSPYVPIEDSLDDPNYQDPAPDLPEPITGNDDSDDMPDIPAIEGEE